MRRGPRIVRAMGGILYHAGAPALLAMCLASARARAQIAHPNFSGTWVMNAAKSRLEVPVPDSTIFIIHHDEPIVRIFRTHATDGKLDTATVILRTDSSEVNWALHGTKLRLRSWWNGDELVFWTGFADGDRPGSQVVRYSISADGKTFTAVERADTPEVKHVNRWVFDRRE